MRVRLVTGADLPLGDDETRFLAGVLRERGWDVDVAIWSDPAVDWADAPLTVIRSTWDYPGDLDGFLTWTETTAAATTLHNPPELVRRNVDKRYLFDLQAAGLSIVPSRWTATLDAATVERAAEVDGWTELVAKPAVGVDGLGVVRLRAGDTPRDSAPSESGWLLQPYLASVVSEGERSVVLFDGRVSHAVSKHPPDGSGEFRVQEQWGGRTRPVPADPAVDAVARDALAAFVGEGATAPLYARIDLLRHDGAWCVAEVEAVEPSFYFGGDARPVATFDDALRARLP